jgi:hypothetical protein
MKQTKTEQTPIIELEARVKQLEDENASLWDMIDEIWASDIKKHAEVMQKAHNELVMERLMRQMKPADA